MASKTIVLRQMANTLRTLKGVTTASVWSKHNMNRIYIDLTAFNGREKVGRTLYFDSDRRALCSKTYWSGDDTREWHIQNQTIKQIRDYLQVTEGDA